MGETALIYCRNSVNSARSIEEQEVAGRADCAHHGWEVFDVLTDGVGASRYSGRERPEWERAKDIIRSGSVGVLVTWEASRAQRDLTAYAELRDICTQHGVKWCYSGRIYDLANGNDRFSTGIDALVSEREADDMVRRIKRAIDANAVEGRPHGRIAFGYLREYERDHNGEKLRNERGQVMVKQVPHPEQALVVERIFREYLNGVGYRTISRGLNADGITTSTGAVWNDQQVKRILKNPTYVARRVHRGEVIGDGDWPAIIDAETFERTQARMQAMTEPGTRKRGEAKLLTGVGRCATCGSKIAAIRDRNARPVYTCKTKFCFGRDLVKLDAYVSTVLLERLQQPDAVDGLTGDSEALRDAQRAISALQARLDEAVSEFASGAISAKTLAAVEAQVMPQIDAAQADARAALGHLNITLPTKGWDEWWAGLLPEQRRELVGVFIARVDIHRTRQGERTFNPDSVSIVWN